MVLVAKFALQAKFRFNLGSVIGPVFGVQEPGVTYTDRPGSYAFILSPDQSGFIAVMRTLHGVYLPGGGADPGESPLQALKREIFEEIGCQVVKAEAFTEATQFLLSRHYKKYFKKMATFYRVKIDPASPVTIEKEHELIWMDPRQAALDLSEEYQRWAVGEYLR